MVANQRTVRRRQLDPIQVRDNILGRDFLLLAAVVFEEVSEEHLIVR